MRQALAGTALWVLIAAVPPAFGQKLATHFFYWYDAPNNNVNGALMPFHPPGLTTPYNGTWYSSLSTAWYQWQLADLKAAGFDYIFPVSWGERYQSPWFRQSVLTRLVDAVRTTGSPIKIGLYDDTQSQAAEWNADSGRGYVNSTTDPNLQLSLAAPGTPWYFYDSKIKPFFQMIPRDLWATHNGLPVSNGGRPMIALFTIYYYKDHAAAGSMWQAVKNAFAADFGVQPWLMPDFSWWYFGGNIASVGDGQVVYGAACSSGTLTYTTPNGYKVSNLGPGCDARLIGRPDDYVPRWADGDGSNDGLDDQWLRDNFRKVPTDVNLILLESWNELWEGTSVSRCFDFPRRTGGLLADTFYMDKTRDLMRELRDRTASPATLQNGGMEGAFSNGVAASWTPFWVYGDVAFAQENTDRRGGTRAQKIHSSWWTHLAGLHQRVAATPGATYTFSAWTFRHDSWNNGSNNEETWVGIDPTGGVDPTSPAIVWSGSLYSYRTWTQQSVTATASANRITVFLRARANYGGGDMRAVFDDCTLTQQQGGTIAGTVSSSAGGTITGATVTASPGSYSTTTGAGGQYSLIGIPAGTYTVTASAAGHNPSTQNNVAVSNNQTTTVHFTLQSNAPVEKMLNGGMEGGFWSTGWGGGSAIPNSWHGWYNPGDFNCFPETGIRRSGAYSARTTISSGGSPGTGGFKRSIHQNVYVGPHANFTIRVWARHTNGNCPSIMCWNPDGDGNPQNAANAGRYKWVTTDNWGQLNTWVSNTLTGTAPASGNITVMVGGAHHGGGGTGTVYIDDCSVTVP